MKRAVVNFALACLNIPPAVVIGIELVRQQATDPLSMVISLSFAAFAFGFCVAFGVIAILEESVGNWRE